MRIVGAMTPEGVAMGLDGFTTVELRSGRVACGMRELPDVQFDPDTPANMMRVLVKVKAFSCNYRDRSIISSCVATAKVNELVPFGSEFCGKVIGVGNSVADLSPGDRVIGVFTYPDSLIPGVLPGIASNRCSQELLVIPAAKLRQMPADMSYAEGAAFSLNGLTVASMLRRLTMSKGERLLILAGRSNVSLFACKAAAALGVETTVITTTETISDRLRAIGAEHVVIHKNPSAGLMKCNELTLLARDGFNGVIDPFMDVHLHQVPELMAIEGRYITCGSAKQAKGDEVAHSVNSNWMHQHFYSPFLIKNISLMGNCLGRIQDLDHALSLWEKGILRVVMDACFPATDAGNYLRRTYVDSDRLGKVVCLFE